MDDGMQWLAVPGCASRYSTVPPLATQSVRMRLYAWVNP